MELAYTTPLIRYLTHITFERDPLIFTAGESVIGSLTFDNAERTQKIYDFQLQLTGVIRQCGHYRPYVENKRHIMDFMNSDLTVHHAHKIKGSADDPVIIPPKTKVVVPFEVQLPVSLWSTFIGNYGHSVYRIMFVGRTDSQFAGPEAFLFLKEIVIIGLVNPIKEGFDLPLTETKAYTNKSGEIAKLTVHLDKTCCSPGELFKFKVVVENGLRLPLASIKMAFQQNVFYQFKRRMSSQISRLNFSRIRQRNQDAKILVQKEGPTIPPGPGRKITWEWAFEIPHVVPSEMGADGCKLIKVSYCIMFVLTKFVNLRIAIPIHVGTRPVSNEADWELASLAYETELRRSLSETSIDSWSVMTNANEGESGRGRERCWTAMSGLQNNSQISRASSTMSVASRSTITGPPSYNSDWDFLPIETPPPMYDHAVNEDEDNDE